MACIVFHAAELSRAKAVFNNIQNLIQQHSISTQDVSSKQLSSPLEIVIVFNSDAVKSLLISPYPYEQESIHWLSLPKTIQLIACENSLKTLNCTQEHLIETVSIVPSGIYYLALLQSEGFFYIRP